jgi:fructose-1-phosphate kinase PfkB-like protein
VPIRRGRFHICGNDIEVQAKIIEILRERGVNRKNISVSIFFSHIENNNNRAILVKIAENVGWMCMNWDEWKTMADILRKMKTSTPSLLISQGSSGALAIKGHQKYQVTTRKKKRFVNSVGSGDVLHGAFVSLHKIRDMNNRISRSVLYASQSCQEYGVLHLLSRKAK